MTQLINQHQRGDSASTANVNSAIDPICKALPEPVSLPSIEESGGAAEGDPASGVPTVDLICVLMNLELKK